MGKLVHQYERRAAFHHRIHIQPLGQGDAVIFHLQARQELEPAQHGFGFNATMRFNNTGYDIHTLLFALVGGFKHGERFPHPGSVAQVNLEPAPAGFFCLDLREQLIGIGAMFHDDLFYLIQRQVQQQDVYALLAQKPDLAVLNVLVDQIADDLIVQAARLRHACNLIICRGRG